MHKNVSGWRHVFKLDPDKTISDEALDAICTSGTDAIIVGGSQGVTFDNTVELLGRVRRYALDCVLEVSSIEAVVPGFDAYYVPFVLNARHPQWLMTVHRRGIEAYGDMVPWDQVVMEGYIILNPDSAAAKLTEAACDLSPEAVLSYAVMADRMFRFPVVYLEYSGKWGDPDLVSQVKSRLKLARLFYGGGIINGERAAQMAEAADTIVVGNVIYDDLEAALSTVRAVKR